MTMSSVRARDLVGDGVLTCGGQGDAKLMFRGRDVTPKPLTTVRPEAYTAGNQLSPSPAKPKVCIPHHVRMKSADGSNNG